MDATGNAAAYAPPEHALRCPTCDYLLVGLPQNRCPECGCVFDPAAVQKWQTRTPPWFEQARGGSVIVAFVGTWLTVLATPWRFAWQTVGGLRGGRAAWFGGICFASTFVSLFFGADPAIIAAWLSTAAVYLILQTAWLVAMDWPHRDRPLHSAGHWLAVGGYTSAIVMTEWYYGPPLFMLSEFVDLISSPRSSSLFSSNGIRSVLAWAQVIVWLIGVVCCVDARLASRARSRRARIIAAFICFASLLVLYSASIEYIGAPLYNFLQDVPGMTW